jgi:hypothetical protein
MEPVSTTLIYNTLVYFIAYYVGTDFYNYCKSQQNYREMQADILDIRSSLNCIKNKLP